MHDTPEKESAYTAMEYRLNVVELANVQMGRMYRQLKEERDAIQQKNDQLVEGLKSIENKLVYLPYDHNAKLIVMDMIDKLFDQLHGEKP